MPDPQDLNLEIRLQAIEFALVEIGKIAMLNAGIDPEDVRKSRERLREGLLIQTLPGADPALADHASAELADRVDALLSRVEHLVTLAYLKADEAGNS